MGVRLKAIGKKSSEEKTTRKWERVVERHQIQTKLQDKCKESLGQRYEASREESVNESQGEQIEWMGDEAKVQVEGSPQVAGAGTGAYRPIFSTHSFSLHFLSHFLSSAWSVSLSWWVVISLSLMAGATVFVPIYMLVWQFVFKLWNSSDSNLHFLSYSLAVLCPSFLPVSPYLHLCAAPSQSYRAICVISSGQSVSYVCVCVFDLNSPNTAAEC